MDPLSSHQIAAPSDVATGSTEARRVGGRVTAVGERSLRLSDAFASLTISVDDVTAADLGSFVVLELTPDGSGWAGRIVERHAGRLLPDGESARAAAGVGVRLELRSRLFRTLREYFVEQRFVEVDTPLRVRTPGLDANVDALSAQDGWLVTSPELQMKRLLVAGLPRVYQLSHVCRAEELGPRHQPEFSLLEWYRAFADEEAVMRDTEELVRRAAALRLPGSIDLDFGAPFERLTVRDAFRRHAGVADAVDLAASDEDTFFQLLVDRVEPALAQLGRPVFLCRYPATQAALARRHAADAGTAERFELYAAGLELCNGFSELTDPVEQRRRFEHERAERRRRQRPVYELDERFLAALAEGMPPAGGNALGVDRLLMLISGAESIAEVQGFPIEWL